MIAMHESKDALSDTLLLRIAEHTRYGWGDVGNPRFGIQQKDHIPTVFDQRTKSSFARAQSGFGELLMADIDEAFEQVLAPVQERWPDRFHDRTPSTRRIQ